jgi:hypothetical protein
MKKQAVGILLFMLLAVVSMACNAMGGDNSSAEAPSSGGGSSSGSSSSGGGKVVRGFPVMADAYEIVDTEMAGMISIVYKSKSSIEDAANFYKTELKASGYTVNQDITTAEAAAIMFSGSKTVNLAIGRDPMTAGAIVVTLSTLP